MEIRFFIQANNKQMIGALVAKASIERNSKCTVEVLNIDRTDYGLDNLKYLKSNVWHTFQAKDLQSFTLIRFFPPTLMEFCGIAIVTDPDIFSIKDLTPLIELAGTLDFDILACKKNGKFDSSLMVLNCETLTELEWPILLERLRSGDLDYLDLITLNFPHLRIVELDRKFNNLDQISEDTVSFHTTNRLTQPWKTGLKIDFTRDTSKFKFGIPLHWLLRIKGEWPSRYQVHPNQVVEGTFFELSQLALTEGKISKSQVEEAISNGWVRSDFWDKIKLKRSS
jgi:hypothetical protein